MKLRETSTAGRGPDHFSISARFFSGTGPSTRPCVLQTFRQQEGCKVAVYMLNSEAHATNSPTARSAHLEMLLTKVASKATHASKGFSPVASVVETGLKLILSCKL